VGGGNSLEITRRKFLTAANRYRSVTAMSVNAALSLIVVGAIPPPFALIRYIVRRYVDAVVENVFGSGDDGVV